MLDAVDKGYFHSVHLLEDKCKGCVNCIKRCPTEAIRVRDGKAHIIEVRCIDCGECVRNCPNKAKTVLADSMTRLKDYKINVALPAPAVYGQFREGTDPRKVLAALLSIGFDHVIDVAFAADMVARKVREVLERPMEVRPLISSACPAVIRLIQVRFPNLIEHIIPMLSPMRAAANIAKHEFLDKPGAQADQVGIWFITPCPGKVSAINDPEGIEESTITGAIPIAEVYPLIREKLRDDTAISAMVDKLKVGSGLGVGWARSGGENQAIGGSRQIAVDGIHNVIQILEEVERGKLSDIDYIEAQACVGGCVGGVLTVENSFITRRRIRLLASENADDVQHDDLISSALECEDWFRHDKPIEPRPTLKLDDDMAVAIRKMEQMERIVEDLPGLDCGSCGAPNCQALAEDVVRGLATEMDCMFKLRERVTELAGEMMLLAEKVPPAMGHVEKKAEEKHAVGEHSTKPEPEPDK
ncbi:MAG: [Fe-Fe] hydrogenase large subunit C-terminal domain-containing protein [Armatimonadota bacterium]|nr:4Fe-4S dicluster domain-containing protein [bacterium]